MTKRDMIEFLAPFTDEIELRLWDHKAGVWKLVAAGATYSARCGHTTIWLTPPNGIVPGRNPEPPATKERE